MGLMGRIKSRGMSLNGVKGNALSSTDKGRKINLSSIRKRKGHPVRPKLAKDEDEQLEQPPPVSYIVTSEPKGKSDEKAEHSSNFDWLCKRLDVVGMCSCTDVINAKHGSSDSITKSGDELLGKDDSMTQSPTATTQKCSESNASENAVDVHVTGWEWICACLGWGSPHKAGDRTWEGSDAGGGSGGNSRTSSYESSCNSYDDDDEGSGDSSQPHVSRVDQVLTVSAMADDISDISLSDSDDDSSHDSKDEGLG
jgi:hypothetical protein